MYESKIKPIVKYSFRSKDSKTVNTDMLGNCAQSRFYWVRDSE